MLSLKYLMPTNFPLLCLKAQAKERKTGSMPPNLPTLDETIPKWLQPLKQEVADLDLHFDVTRVPSDSTHVVLEPLPSSFSLNTPGRLLQSTMEPLPRSSAFNTSGRWPWWHGSSSKAAPVL